MEDWCKWCVYADRDGADDPCFECESDNDGAPTRFTAKRKMLTNADKYFRNATDEELAERLSKQNFWNCPPHGETCPGYCRECWLDWLKQEVSDED